MERKKRCQFPGCKTILTTYNENKACFVHVVAYADMLDGIIHKAQTEIKKLKFWWKERNKIQGRIRKLKKLIEQTRKRY